MSNDGAAARAAACAPGPSVPAAASLSNARAEASRKNGARSRGPKTLEGKTRSAQNALKHGMRAQRYVVLPDEDAGEFAALEAAMIAELAPVGALQAVLARRVAVAAWRLARADRMETELFEERRWDNRGVGVALIRDGNGTRSFETLMRYRGAAMAEFMRALRTLKALQAGQAAATDPIPAAHPTGRAPRPAVANRRHPNEPERDAPHRLEYAPPEEPVPDRTLHEPAVPWMPNEPDAERPARPNQPPSPAEPRLVSQPPFTAASGERRVCTALGRANPSAGDRTNPATR
jgi:hypothetical protein